MYLTIDQLKSRTPNAHIYTREHDSHRVFYAGKKCTVFLSHRHDDLAQLRCTADVTGGKFIEADTNAQLVQSMEELILPHK